MTRYIQHIVLAILLSHSVYAEPTMSDALIGVWKSIPSDRKNETKTSDLVETSFNVPRKGMFFLTRSVAGMSTTYMGSISEHDGSIVAEVFCGPVVCGSKTTKNDRWTISIVNDNMTITFSERERQSFVRSATSTGEQAGTDQPATKPADKPAVKDKPSTPTPKDAPR